MAEHFVMTPAAPARCRCGAPLLVGYSEGLKVRVDEETVGEVGRSKMGETIGRQVGELDVLLRGGRTFVRNGLGWLLERDEARIRNHLVPGTIHAEHMCPAQVAATRRAA